MKTVLALDPGYSGTRAGMWDLAGNEIGMMPVSEGDPIRAAEAKFGVSPSIVVLPGGSPGNTWHPLCAAASLARAYCLETGVPLLEVSPRCPAELPPEALLSGYGDCRRRGWFYSVPQWAAFDETAAALGIARESARIITVYLGEEVAVTAHHGLRVADTSDPSNCEGPFGFTSAGTLPATSFVAWVAASKRGTGDLRDELKRRSGAFAYAGVRDVEALREALDAGETDAVHAVAGMAYQVSKEIGRQAAALRGKVDGVALCGPGARLDALVRAVEERVRKWFPVYSIREDLTMQALVREGIRELLSRRP